MNMKVYIHVKEGGLKKKELDGAFIFGSSNVVEKEFRGRTMGKGKENGISDNVRNNAIGKANDVCGVKAGKCMRHDL